MKSLFFASGAVFSILLSFNVYANPVCNITGGAEAGLSQAQMDKFYNDIFAAVKRLGWTSASGIKDCSAGDMRFPKLPLITTDGELIVMHTGKSWIKYQQDTFDSAPLCYDMKMQKTFRIEGSTSECF